MRCGSDDVLRGGGKHNGDSFLQLKLVRIPSQTMMTMG
jgi:hypothetical protein